MVFTGFLACTLIVELIMVILSEGAERDSRSFCKVHEIHKLINSEA